MPSQPPSQHTPREALLQFGHVLQQELFPRLEEALSAPLEGRLALLVAVLSLVPVARMLQLPKGRGRRARDRAALATAFIAKAVLNLETTRDLIRRLAVDSALRRLCGWHKKGLPHESKFSRAFSEFARTELPQRLHQAVIETTQKGRLIGHIARDATAIAARERFPESPQQMRERPRKEAKKPKPKKGHHPRKKASERGTRIQRQRRQEDVTAMLAELTRECGLGVKTSSQGHRQYWRGYKLHLDVADGQIPITAILTGASVHDSQVAVPLMRLTSQRVTYCYDLMDAAYDADELLAESRSLNHVPIVGRNARRGSRGTTECPKAFPAKAAPALDWAQQERYKLRTMSERVNARLKDEFGAGQIRVRGHAKVMAHLMFGVLALTVDQWLRMGRRE
ncbi:MAG: transposase [Bryobacteraceae bacterium]|nr:transposase [Bryobacteraceae bacterium]